MVRLSARNRERQHGAPLQKVEVRAHVGWGCCPERGSSAAPLPAGVEEWTPASTAQPVATRKL